MTETKNRPGWQPGQSGNPRGRKPGSGQVAKLRGELAKQLPEIVNKVVEKALGGDMRAASLLLERVIPPMKAMDPAVVVNLKGGTLSDKARAVIDATGVGELTPGQSAQLLAAIASMATVVKADEHEERLKRVEEGLRNAGHL